MYRVLTSPKQLVPAIRHEPGIDCESVCLCVCGLFYNIDTGFTCIPITYLMSTSPPILTHHTDKDIEEKALSALNSAQKKIKLDIHDLSEQLKASRESIGKLKEQIEQAEDDT